MPTVYRLVPGSVVVKFWFNSVFLPDPADPESEVVETDIFAMLMVTATSIALGLLLGMAVVNVATCSTTALV